MSREFRQLVLEAKGDVVAFTGRRHRTQSLVSGGSSTLKGRLQQAYAGGLADNNAGKPGKRSRGKAMTRLKVAEMYLAGRKPHNGHGGFSTRGFRGTRSGKYS